MADITGHGTEFQRSTDGGSSYSTIAGVFGISGPDMTRDTVETTDYGSTGGWREKIGGLRDGGSVTFTLNFARSEYLTLKGDFENDDPIDYQIVLPDSQNTTISFKGLVTDLPMSIPEGDRVTVDVTIEVAGAVNDDST